MVYCRHDLFPSPAALILSLIPVVWLALGLFYERFVQTFHNHVALVVAYLRESKVGLVLHGGGFRGGPRPTRLRFIVSGLLIRHHKCSIRRSSASCSLVFVLELDGVLRIGKSVKQQQTNRFELLPLHTIPQIVKHVPDTWGSIDGI
jgi:hypothetical protein